VVTVVEGISPGGDREDGEEPEARARLRRARTSLIMSNCRGEHRQAAKKALESIGYKPDSIDVA